MFHARIDEDDKKTILESVVQADGICRIVFFLYSSIWDGCRCTQCVLLSTVVRLQMLIISRRVDILAEMVNLVKLIFYYPSCLLDHVRSKMKGYCKLNADKCRRGELLHHFLSSAAEYHDAALPKHVCCDHCTIT